MEQLTTGNVKNKIAPAKTQAFVWSARVVKECRHCLKVMKKGSDNDINEVNMKHNMTVMLNPDKTASENNRTIALIMISPIQMVKLMICFLWV